MCLISSPSFALLWVGNYSDSDVLDLKVHIVFPSLAPSCTILGEITHVLHRNSTFCCLCRRGGIFHEIVDPYRAKMHFFNNAILSLTYPRSNEKVHFTCILALRNYVIWIPFILNIFLTDCRALGLGFRVNWASTGWYNFNKGKYSQATWEHH